jgi:DNA-binding transcriptional regulator YdaS (Cro superfamily)
MRLADYLEETKETQRAFGARLGVTQSAVAQMVAGQVGAERVLKVAEATGWRVRPNDLRPDLYPHPEDGMPRGGQPMVRDERAAA